MVHGLDQYTTIYSQTQILLSKYASDKPTKRTCPTGIQSTTPSLDGSTTPSAGTQSSEDDRPHINVS